jgi:hypothetical protein
VGVEPVSAERRSEEEEAVSAALASLAAELDRDAPPARLENDLRVAFRRRRAGVVPPRRVWPAGLAAAALLAVIVSLVWRPRPSDLEPRAADGGDLVFALRPGESPEDLESGQVIRVRLSSAALRAMGVAVDSGGADVEADVLMGYDGVARAVRVARHVD